MRYYLKLFLAKKGKEKFLKSFLETLLKIPVKQVEGIQEASLEQPKITDKLGRLDIKATIDKNKIVNIELQMTNERNMEERSLFYGAKLICEQMGKGDKYIDRKPVILNYNLFDLPEYHIETVQVVRGHRDYEVGGKLAYHYIELPKFRKESSQIRE